jgi:hypothetical protein
MAEQEDKPIRVVDRRMFTPDGELRPDFEPEEASAPAPPPARPPEPAAARVSRPAAPAAPGAPPAASAGQASPREAGAPPAEAGAEDPHGEFTAIVRSLATTAYAALGLLADPAGARRQEPAVARQMIDWLTVLESKTRNNLSFEESDFLARLLYDLRLAYVEVTRPPGR